MCNRYRAIGKAALAAEALERYGVVWDPPDSPRYNIGPNQILPIFVRDDSGKPVATLARWNLIPFFEKADKPTYLRTNARSEDVLTKASYREAIQKRRCLVPADGFYEWEHLADGKIKLPWAFELEGARPFVFAGLWERGNETRPPSFTILTTTPNPLVARIHNRMPVILAAEAAPRWFEPGPMSKETLAPFVVPFPPERMRGYRVNPSLNSVRNDTAEAAAPCNPDEPIPAADSEPAGPVQGELF